jgi:hypothetical protein
MARSLLSFVPKATPAKAHVSVNAHHRTARLMRHYQALLLLAPDLAAHLEHVAADLHSRADGAPLARVSERI